MLGRLTTGRDGRTASVTMLLGCAAFPSACSKPAANQDDAVRVVLTKTTARPGRPEPRAVAAVMQPASRPTPVPAPRVAPTPAPPPRHAFVDPPLPPELRD